MESSEKSGSNRMVLLLIGGFPLTMILAATWLWYFGERGDLDVVGLFGTANRGILVQPARQIDDLPLYDEAGSQTSFAELGPRWTMLVPGTGVTCASSCEHSLYLTRQIHVAMGKEFNRLRRLYVSQQSTAQIKLSVTQLSDQRPPPDAGNFASYLASDHRGLKALRVADGGTATLFAEYLEDPTTWYLVDPAGWIMMAYNSEIPYKDVISDLKFLLKNSGG